MKSKIKYNLKTYSEAINEATEQAMTLDKNVVVIGQMVDAKPGIFGTTKDLYKKFGEKRVLDFPVSESLMTSSAIGAAVAGSRVVLVHIRNDFMIYSYDAIINWMSLWRFKSNGKSSSPVVIRAIVGKGWGQGPQHSKSLHSWFANLPGVNVAMPSTAYEAKGILIESIFSDNPTIIFEHRSLYNLKDYVPSHPYRIPFSKARVHIRGNSITLLAIGVLLPIALRVSEKLKRDGINCEVIDPITISPLDTKTIIKSLKKTRKIAILDPSWSSFGAASGIIGEILEQINFSLKKKPLKIGYPNSHTPMSSELEKKYYLNEEKVLNLIRKKLL